MRGSDGGPWNKICALPALWVGLFYCNDALDAAWDLVKDWTIEEHQRIRDAVPREGLQTVMPDGRTMQELGKQVLDIAAVGLSARGHVNSMGDNEGGFLNPLRTIIDSGMSPAQLLLERFNGEWGGDLSRVYDEMSF